jgi:hypothetical protein
MQVRNSNDPLPADSDKVVAAGQEVTVGFLMVMHHVG